MVAAARRWWSGIAAQKQSEQESRSNDSAWHLDKKVNLSHIVATLTLAAAIFTWGSKIEQRIALVEASATRQAQVDQAQARLTSPFSPTVPSGTPPSSPSPEI